MKLSLSQQHGQQRHESLASIKAWRRDIHQYPELGFNEQRTAELVAAKLKGWGIETHCQIGGTGVVGKLVFGNGGRAIGLRADMDALPIEEHNTFVHRSCHQGIFHGCGHDGHTAMLLGAARQLAALYNSPQADSLDGTVYLVFQPAEEGLGGAMAMIDDGLFERFPMQAIFGMHNMPGIEVGQFAITEGPIMAAHSLLDIELQGKGGHAAMPHECSDPIVVSAAIIQLLQTLVSRHTDPQQTAVLSITQVHAGDAYNVIPHSLKLAGGLRVLDEKLGASIRQRINDTVQAMAELHGMQATVSFSESSIVLNNNRQPTLQAIAAATAVVGEHNIAVNTPAILASEDFAYFLKEKPGAFIFIGNGDSDQQPMLHHPRYDFNDAALIYGVDYWLALTRQQLAAASPCRSL